VGHPFLVVSEQILARAERQMQQGYKLQMTGISLLLFNFYLCIEKRVGQMMIIDFVGRKEQRRITDS